MRRISSPSLVVALLALAAGTRNAAAQSHMATPTERPKLVVFLTVDQMRSDYVDRWKSQYTGGLKRLGQQGAFFVNAFQDHANTETAPGHSVTMAGRFPRSTGIVSNTTGVLDPQAPLLTSRDAPASPYRFRGSVLMDWLRVRDPRSRGLSISRKDRGAILPFGRAKQSVFWYATSNGEFTTSRYYADTLPDWIRKVNARRVPQGYAGRSWTLSMPVESYPEADSQAVENAGRDFLFPHTLPSDTARAVSEFVYTPWIDELTLSAALEGLQSLAIGAGTSTDVLAISLSGSDYVGHRYGPDSREQHDNYLRLDHALGAFIDSLYKLRDSSSIVFALTADHGVTSYPELVAARNNRPAPVRFDVKPAVTELRAALRSAKVDTMAISLDGATVYVNRRTFELGMVDPEPILAKFIAKLRATPGIVRVDRVKDLAKRDTTRDAVARRWIHMLPLDVPVEYVFTPAQGAYPLEARIAEHGAPYDDDAHVPVIFYGPWIKPGRYTERALVADMAPTLARIAGVPPTEKLDGHVLEKALTGTGKP
ncbi:MAG: alkaline phosphatase family protein [Gemmatimonadaceae bacterium]